jgi:Flp pilus assembly protein TadD
MSCRFRSTVLLVVGFLVFVAHSASGKPLEDREWIEVRTPNFQVRSILSEKKTLALTLNLELFRKAFSAVTNVSETASPVPTDIYLVRGGKDFEELGIDPDWEGLFQAGLRRNYIVIRDVPGEPESYVLNRKYALFLLGDQGSVNYPLWYKIGFAEYLSTAQAHGGEFIIGGANEYLLWRTLHYPWIPLREILSREHDDAWSGGQEKAFHAEARMLVCFLIHRPEHDRLSKDMAHFVDLVESGKDEVEAFEESFRISLIRLYTRMLRFFQDSVVPVYKVNIDEILPNPAPKAVALPRERIALGLGQVALSQGNLRSAIHWFEVASTDDVAAPRAQAGWGDVLRSIGRLEDARTHFEEAVELAPDDPYCQLDFGKYWYDLAKRSDDPSERATYLSRARERLVAAWKLDDSIPETYVLYGQTFLMEGERIDLATDVLKKAESLLPSNLTVRVLLAKAYRQAGDNDAAAMAARSVLVWSSPESNAAQLAREIVDQSADNH